MSAEKHAGIYTELQEYGVPYKIVKTISKHYEPQDLKWNDQPKELPSERDKPWIYLHGPPGTGKSTYSAYLMSLYLLTRCSELPASSNSKAPFYIRTSRLLQKMKSDFDSKQREGAELFERCLESRFLVLDDLTNTPSTWELSQLDLLIDTRYGDLSWTVITSNHSLAQLKNELSERITSRINEISELQAITARKR